MKCQRLSILCGCAVAVSLLSGSFAQADVIEDFSVVVGGDYTASAQVWGGVLARGDVSGSATIGSQLTPASNYANAMTLGVGGTISGGPFNMSAGSVHLSGTQGGVSINLNGGAGTQIIENDSSVTPLANSGVNEITTVSNIFESYASNSSVAVSGTNVTFNPILDTNNVAIFDIDSSLLTLQNANYILNLAGMPADATYLINVATDIATGIPVGNFPAGFGDVSEYIMWNFHDQTSDLLIAREWQGSILLPNANISNSGAINGGVYAGGNFLQNADVRLTGYQGFVPAAVPEPSSFALLGLVGLAYAGRRWRRRGLGASVPSNC